MKSTTNKLWVRFVAWYWARARRSAEDEAMLWIYPRFEPLSPAETPMTPTSLPEAPRQKQELRSSC
jgi:hypothetical protein